jgi:hypothetical protein
LPHLSESGFSRLKDYRISILLSLNPYIIIQTLYAVPYNNTTVAARVLEFQVNTPRKSLVITVARLIYKRFEYNTWMEIKKEAFVPAGVIDARYAG